MTMQLSEKMNEATVKLNDLLSVSALELGECVGLYIKYHTAADINMKRETGIKPKSEIGVVVDGMKHALIVRMSCGEVMKFKKFKDIPDHEVMCPCGDKSHKIIEYR